MNKKLWLAAVVTLLLSALVSCGPAPTPIPTSVPPSTSTPIPTANPEANGCLTPGPGQALLRKDAEGYCLLYPQEYSTDLLPNYIVINPVPGPGDIPGDAWVYLLVEPAAGRTAAQVVDKESESFVGPGFNITRSEQTVDGVQAVVVDGLPSTDSVRKVFMVHNDRLYNFWFMPWFPGETGPTPIEDLYSMVMDSLRFIPVIE